MQDTYQFTVNGQVCITAENKPLLRYLRDDLHLYSVKDGCSEGACGTCTVIIDGSDEIRVNIAWYLLWYNGEEPINEEDTDNATFSGYEWGNGLHTTGSGTFDIDYFYQIGEYQYAVGKFTAPSGETATVGMIRP